MPFLQYESHYLLIHTPIYFSYLTPLLSQNIDYSTPVPRSPAALKNYSPIFSTISIERELL
jgi:hypothetical protein